MLSFKGHIEKMLIVCLQEEPWIQYIESGEQLIFDLEFERYVRKPNDFLLFLQYILQGERYQDKYGDVIHLKSKKQKENFLKALQYDITFKLIWKKYYPGKNMAKILKGYM